MPIPKQSEIEIPLLRVIADSGGELPMREAVKLVTLMFPNLSIDDLNKKLPSGPGNYWTNRVRWTRQGLVVKGELDKSTRGVWRITDKGRARLLQESSPALANPPGRNLLPPSPARRGSNQLTLATNLVSDESNLYEHVLKWLNENWGKEVKQDGDDYWVRTTATQVRRGQPGKWSRPDLTSIEVSRFDILPERSIEVTTFEVKKFSDSLDVASIYEAASHQRWANYTYLVVEVPSPEHHLPDYLTTEAARFGVGVLALYAKTDGSGYEMEEILGPKRQNPEPKELDRMLGDFFSYDEKELRRFRDLIR